MTKINDTSATALKILNKLDELGTLLPLECTHVDHFNRKAQDVKEY